MKLCSFIGPTDEYSDLFEPLLLYYMAICEDNDVIPCSMFDASRKRDPTEFLGSFVFILRFGKIKLLTFIPGEK